jgi:hypothetical protein
LLTPTPPPKIKDSSVTASCLFLFHPVQRRNTDKVKKNKKRETGVVPQILHLFPLFAAVSLWVRSFSL